MPLEDPRNIGFVCDAHASRPNAHFATLPVEWFIGKFVKLGFPAKTPDGGASTEHMWVKVLKPHDGDPPEELVGELDNDPVYDVGYVCGDWVGFSRAEIEKVYGYHE